MGKSDNSIARRKNRKIRKKQENKDSSSKVSARVASIIAAKKRRMSGKRRHCQVTLQERDFSCSFCILDLFFSLLILVIIAGVQRIWVNVIFMGLSGILLSSIIYVCSWKKKRERERSFPFSFWVFWIIIFLLILVTFFGSKENMSLCDFGGHFWDFVVKNCIFLLLEHHVMQLQCK